MKNFIITFLILFGIWILLNNSLQVDILISGLVVSAIISGLLCTKCQIFEGMNVGPKGIMMSFLFLGVFMVDLVKSNFDVAKRVLSPSLPINPGIVEVKTKLTSKFGRMLLANSITLTPGTLTVEVKDDSFFIHWIDVQEIDIDRASKDLVDKFEKYLMVIYG